MFLPFFLMAIPNAHFAIFFGPGCDQGADDFFLQLRVEHPVLFDRADGRYPNSSGGFWRTLRFFGLLLYHTISFLS
jgi:hypothetical protein